MCRTCILTAFVLGLLSSGLGIFLLGYYFPPGATTLTPEHLDER